MQHIEDNTAQNTVTYRLHIGYISVTEHRTQQYNMQHIEQDTEKKDTEQNAQDNTYTSTEHSTDNLYTYSVDFYNEYVAIKNSDTIEIYTISK